MVFYDIIEVRSLSSTAQIPNENLLIFDSYLNSISVDFGFTNIYCTRFAMKFCI